MAPHTIRALAVAAVVALTTTSLVGCGGAKTDPEPGELRLGYFPNVTHAPALVGVANGTFQRHLGEVELETTVFNAGPSAIEALFSDAIDATYIGPNPAINGWAMSAGDALHIIAGTTSGGAGLVVRPEIETIDDLRGKTIATPQLGNTQDVALRYWLQHHGYAIDRQGGGDVVVLPIPNSEIITGYGSGAIDGAFVPEPHLSLLSEELGARLLLDEADEWPDGEFVTAHLIVRSEFLAQHPDLVTNLLAAHIELIDFVNEQPESARELVNTQLESLTGNRLRESVLTAALANLTFTVDPIARSLYGSADHAIQVGLLDPVDLTGIYHLTPLNELLQAQGQAPVSGDPA